MAETAEKTKQKTGAPKRGRPANEWTLTSMDAITRFLAERSMSQSAFAQTIGVTNSTYHNWKNGRSTPHASIQHKIAEVLAGRPVPTDVPAAATNGNGAAPAETSEHRPKSRNQKPREKSATLSSLSKGGRPKGSTVDLSKAAVQAIGQVDDMIERNSAFKKTLAEVRRTIKALGRLAR